VRCNVRGVCEVGFDGLDLGSVADGGGRDCWFDNVSDYDGDIWVSFEDFRDEDLADEAGGACD